MISRPFAASTSLILFLSGALACGSGRPSGRAVAEVQPPPVCTAPPSGDAPALTATQGDALAGRYELNVVATAGVGRDTVVRGTLELWRPDSAYAHGLVRPSESRRFLLVGASDVDLRRLAPVSLAYPPSSRDRERPGVEVQSDGTMWFGNAFGGTGGTLDAGVALKQVRIMPWGFRGEWLEGGLAVVNGVSPGGYFCAVRVTK